MSFKIYFLLFIIYAFTGWLIEVVGQILVRKKFVNRGFLLGPYCPIYGFGAIAMTLFLKNYTDDIIVLFFMSMLICGFLEYLTSYVMEKLFKARWWDYSDKKFNINGRVCLEMLIPFGLGGCFVNLVSNPFILDKLNLLPSVGLNILFYTLLIIYLADNIISFKVISHVKKTGNLVKNDLDNTEEITNKVKEIILGKSIIHRRIIKAYPKLKISAKNMSKK